MSLLEEVPPLVVAMVKAILAELGDDADAKVRAILDAELAASRAAVDVMEQQAIDIEVTP